MSQLYPGDQDVKGQPSMPIAISKNTQHAEAPGQQYDRVVPADDVCGPRRSATGGISLRNRIPKTADPVNDSVDKQSRIVHDELFRLSRMPFVSFDFRGAVPDPVRLAIRDWTATQEGWPLPKPSPMAVGRLLD